MGAQTQKRKSGDGGWSTYSDGWSQQKGRCRGHRYCGQWVDGQGMVRYGGNQCHRNGGHGGGSER